MLLVLAGSARAQPAPQPLPVLDVPFISQSEALCGGAAAAMVLRYWGERGLTAESFAPLVDESAAGIRTDALIADLRRRGWNATGIEGTADLIARELEANRPVLTLIEDRPGTFHYIVIVSATPRAVVFHDPARAPFRVMTRAEFEQRWRAADRWMAVVVPGAETPRDAAPEPLSSAAPGVRPGEPRPSVGGTRCEQLVSDGVRLAQARDLDGAERALGAALSCQGPAALRELAGVRLLQRRWPEVAELAAAALAEDPRDAYSWRLLGTARFLQNDRDGALEAWNQIGEPRLDLVVVDGLRRTRPRVVDALMNVPPGDMLTAERLARAARRLEALPSSALSRLEYVPVPTGLAELRATVAERPVLPSTWGDFAGLGLMAAVRREVDVSLGAPTGGGERIDLSWRFWPNRRRLGASIEAPAPWGGLWAAGLFTERQPFDVDDIAAAERLGARVSVFNWLTSSIRLSAQGGTDRWTGAGTFAHGATGVRFASRNDALVAQVDLAGWTGRTRFSAIDAGVVARSSPARRGLVFVGRGGGAVASAGTPLDLWYAGDTGHARPMLLRAHSLLDDGRLRVERLGRRIAHASGEAQRWWTGPLGTAAAAALFVDLASVDRRIERGALRDVDVGIGVRLAVPGLRGVVRADLGKGLRDGSTAVSVAYEP